MEQPIKEVGGGIDYQHELELYGLALLESIRKRLEQRLSADELALYRALIPGEFNIMKTVEWVLEDNEFGDVDQCRDQLLRYLQQYFDRKLKTIAELASIAAEVRGAFKAIVSSSYKGDQDISADQLDTPKEGEERHIVDVMEDKGYTPIAAPKMYRKFIDVNPTLDLAQYGNEVYFFTRDDVDEIARGVDDSGNVHFLIFPRDCEGNARDTFVLAQYLLEKKVNSIVYAVNEDDEAKEQIQPRKIPAFVETQVMTIISQLLSVWICDHTTELEFFDDYCLNKLAHIYIYLSQFIEQDETPDENLMYRIEQDLAYLIALAQRHRRGFIYAIFSMSVDDVVEQIDGLGLLEKIVLMVDELAAKMKRPIFGYEMVQQARRIYKTLPEMPDDGVEARKILEQAMNCLFQLSAIGKDAFEVEIQAHSNGIVFDVKRKQGERPAKVNVVYDYQQECHPDDYEYGHDDFWVRD